MVKSSKVHQLGGLACRASAFRPNGAEPNKKPFVKKSERTANLDMTDNKLTAQKMLILTKRGALHQLQSPSILLETNHHPDYSWNGLELELKGPGLSFESF